MVKAEGKLKFLNPQLEKSPTGIKGLDETTRGGLPKGRPTLVCGSAGSGKTLLAMEFLVKGALQFNEPGVFMAFEETAEELIKNYKKDTGSLKAFILKALARVKGGDKFLEILSSEYLTDT